MKVNFKFLSATANGIFISLLPNYGFAATGNINNSNLWINTIVYGALLVMIIFAFSLIKGAKKLNESEHQDKKEGAEWINHKIYDFNAEQLEILIKEIKRMESDNQKTTIKK